ncbi:Ras family protein [Necator americanus]|uniref:Ras family protein n=1 Tax=Necator americanus TaxID=51031 RepID=W2TYP3_NECAM|nr:Ras family protein [Necator americanus]ETN86759.1 Ras family protein [Necator americanus]
MISSLNTCKRQAKCFRTIKRHLSLETLKLIRQRSAAEARAVGKQKLTSDLVPEIYFFFNYCHTLLKADVPLPEISMTSVLNPSGLSLANELESVEPTPPYYDPYTEALRQQLAEQDNKPKQDLSTIYEHPVRIKRPQYRPMEPDIYGVSPVPRINSPQSLAEELSEAEKEEDRKNAVDITTPDRIFKVVFVGDSAVGKTCFLHRYVNKFCYNRFKPLFNATIGVDFTVKTIKVGSRVVALQLWDTAGQERFRSITKQYFRKADGVLLLFDVTSEQSFLNVRNWIESVRAGVDETTVMALVGNKVDLFGSDSTRNSVYRAGKKLAEEFGMPFYETSAYTGYGIDHCMKTIAERLQKREEQHLQDALKLEMEPSSKKRSWCCL